MATATVRPSTQARNAKPPTYEAMNWFFTFAEVTICSTVHAVIYQRERRAPFHRD